MWRATTAVLIPTALMAGQGLAAHPGAPTAQDAAARPASARDDGEARVLAVLEAMGDARDRRHLAVSEEDGRLLRLLTEAVGAKRVVEVGTSTGYSGLWFALALRATGGRLVTHELDPGRAETARANFEQAGVAELVTVVVGDAHETVKRVEEPVDVVFLDADKPGYVDYLEKLLPKVRPGGLILAHNMRRPEPDPRFVEAITEDPRLETSFLLMDGGRGRGERDAEEALSRLRAGAASPRAPRAPAPGSGCR
jgi:predicted O-methyltransferase YrrM